MLVDIYIYIYDAFGREHLRCHLYMCCLLAAWEMVLMCCLNVGESICIGRDYMFVFLSCLLISKSKLDVKSFIPPSWDRPGSQVDHF